MGKPARIIRFGAFEVALDSGQLRKNGLKLKLREQAFQVLAALLERPGEVVTREKLRERLWPDNTFVDFDQGLNTAITRIREALGDSAANPRFVETLPRRGYRFITPVELPQAAAQPSVDDPAGSGPANPQKRRTWLPGPTAVLAILALAIGVLAGLWLQRPKQTTEIPFRKFTITPEEYLWHTEISPNGRYIAYTAGTPPNLWIFDFQQDQPRRVEGTVEATLPFWSPNSEYIGFAVGAELKRVSVNGGDTAALCRFQANERFLRGTWSPDGGSIVFSCFEPFGVRRLYEVAARGGSPKILTSAEVLGPDTDFPGLRAQFVAFLPRTLVGESSGFGRRIVTWDLATSKSKTLAEGRWPVFTSTGQLLYQSYVGHSPRSARDSAKLLAQQFSIETLESVSEPFPVAENATRPSVSEDGTLVYTSPGRRDRQLVLLDRNGDTLGTIGPPQKSIRGPALSPDGRFVAVYGTEADDFSIWVHDIERAVKRQLTFSSGGFRPIWSPDGKHILFVRKNKIYLVSAVTSGKREELFSDQGFPCDYSSDGLYFVYQQGKDLWYRRDGGEPAAFTQTRFVDRVGKLSPDGRFLAYCSLRSGRNEVYVQAFPEGGPEWLISPHGGTQPRWSGNGKELFYVTDDTLFAVPVTLSPSFSWDLPRPLFSHAGLVDSTPEQQYDVTDDGERFIVVDALEPGPDERPSIHVVQNWLAEFRDREQD